MRESFRWALLVLSVLLIALVSGFIAATILVVVMQAVLPFRSEDEGTLRELVPAALAYLAWAAGSGVTFALGWRRIRRYR